MKVPAKAPPAVSPEQGALGSGLEVPLGAGRTALPFLLFLRAPGGKAVDVVEESRS